MSTDTDDAADDPAEAEMHSTEADDEGQELTLEEQKRRARQARQQTKTFVFEWPDGATSEYEYRMLDEDEDEELRQKHTKTFQGRGGDMETEIERKDLHISLIKKAVTEGPQGYKATRRSIEESTTPEMREQLAEAIQSFSRMDTTERLRFR